MRPARLCRESAAPTWLARALLHGFGPWVSLRRSRAGEFKRKPSSLSRGTEGSNPSSSSVIGAAAAGISSEAAEAQRSRLLPKIEATDDEASLQLPPQRAVAILTSSLGRYIPGTSAAFISGLEQGRRNPTIVSIYELANALGVSHIELVRPIEGQ
jgi:transcriptional regulator with XRE-family HTH domain